MNPIEKFNFKYNFRFPPTQSCNASIDSMIAICECKGHPAGPSPNLANELREFKKVNGRKWYEPLTEIN